MKELRRASRQSRNLLTRGLPINNTAREAVRISGVVHSFDRFDLKSTCTSPTSIIFSFVLAKFRILQNLTR